MRCRPFAALALCLAVLLSAGSSAWAWGALGHRLTAPLAERHLTPEALAAVKDLLDDGETLAEASLWADPHKREVRGSAPWHYVNATDIGHALNLGKSERSGWRPRTDSGGRKRSVITLNPLGLPV